MNPIRYVQRQLSVRPQMKPLPMIAAMVLGLAISTVSAPPVHAGLFSFKPSVKDQIKAGDQAAEEIRRQYHVIYNEQADRLNTVGDRLLNAPGSERGPWHWSFELVDSNEVNAFALPGGHVFMFAGLMNRLQNDDELAAVLGHEMTHVRKQHWASAVAAQQKRSLGLGVILGITRAGAAWQTVADLGNSMINLRYSRGEEEQADLGGLENMKAAGYNPNGMIELFRLLQKAAGGGGPEFLSDHPLTSHRITAAQEAIRKMGVTPAE